MNDSEVMWHAKTFLGLRYPAPLTLLIKDESKDDKKTTLMADLKKLDCEVELSRQEIENKKDKIARDLLDIVEWLDTKISTNQKDEEKDETVDESTQEQHN
jgi:hypothetical protein